MGTENNDPRRDKRDAIEIDTSPNDEKVQVRRPDKITDDDLRRIATHPPRNHAAWPKALCFLSSHDGHTEMHCACHRKGKEKDALL